MLARSTMNVAPSKVISRPTTNVLRVNGNKHRRAAAATRTAAASTPPSAAPAAAAAGPRPTEPAAIAAFKASAGPTRDACVKLLEEAAVTRRVAPELVEGALAWLEADMATAGGDKGGSPAAAVDGTWRLVFSTSTPQRFFQYIPVKEDLTVDASAGAVALASEVGPLRFVVRGAGGPAAGDARAVDFRFTAVDVLLGSSKIWTFAISSSKPKTYTFYYRGVRVSAARSSAGGLSLLLK